MKQKAYKISIGLLAAGVVFYGLLFKAHFVQNLLYKLNVLIDVGLYFAIAAAGYMAAWLIIEKDALKKNKDVIFPFEPIKKPVKAEEYILDVLTKHDRPLSKHGNVTLKEHSLKVAELIETRNPLRIARLAALAHDMGKTMVAAGEYVFHDKLSFGMLNNQTFSDLTGTDREAVLLAVKYHHDPYIPVNLAVETKSLLETLKWADQTATYGEKAAVGLSDKEVYQAIRTAFDDLLKQDGAINGTDLRRLVFYKQGEIFCAIEHRLRDGIINNLDPAVAMQIGVDIERSPGQLHPAFKVIKAALRDIIVPSEKGLHNLRSGKKVIRGIVLFDAEKVSLPENCGEWPYALEVLPWD